jgi:glycosyltransferase involved in cell wall biosynthesis
MFPLRSLLVLTGAYGEPGGIEAYNRLAIRAFGEISESEGGTCEALILNDRAVDAPRLAPGVRMASFDGRRVAFSRAVVGRVIASRPTLIFWGHVNFAPLAALCAPIARPARQWFAIHGIDAWGRLPAIRRAVLKRADRILSVSDFTRRAFVSSNGVGAERVDLLPCALDPVWASRYPHPPAPSPEVLERGGASSDGVRTPSLAHALATHDSLLAPHDSLLTPHSSLLSPHSSLSPILLTVTRLSRADDYKGVDEVLRALPAVVRRVARARYVVVGDGDDRPRLEALSRELGVAASVEFRGRVAAGELADAYRECALFVMPSSGEGFGIVFLEAAHFGRPSIAGAHGGSPEIVLDGVTGRVVEKGETKRLAAAIVELLENPEQAEGMGRAARERVERLYSYDKFRDRLAALLEPVIASEAADAVTGREGVKA